MHVNRQVREAARCRLEDAGVVAVFTNHGVDLLGDQLPAAIVSTGLDEVEGGSKDGLERRSITLTVVIVAAGDSDTVDDNLDDLRVAVEEAMSDDLGGLAQAMEHTGSELELGTSEDGDEWFAFLALSWTVQIWTEKGNPEVAL